MQRISPQTEAVLFALAEQGGSWSHGYDLCGKLGLKAGTVYPILMRLADRGQVDAAWEQVAARGRPPRHLYRLSSSGAELVRQIRAKRVTAPRQVTNAVAPAPRPAIGSAVT